MPTTPFQFDAVNASAALASAIGAVRDARFVAVGQAAAVGVKFSDSIRRITIGGIAVRIIRVGVASP